MQGSFTCDMPYCSKPVSNTQDYCQGCRRANEEVEILE